MSEKLKINLNIQEQYEQNFNPEELLPAPEPEKLLGAGDNSEIRTEINNQEMIRDARDKIKENAESQEIETTKIEKQEIKSIETEKSKESRLQVDLDDTKQTISAPKISKQLQTITAKREIDRVRMHLNPAQKGFSKIIHQPIIKTASEVGGKTISRPSGLLGGGIVALIGSSIYIYLSRHYDFTYNNAIFLVFFVGGFLVGIIVEMIIRSIKPKKVY